METLDHRRTVAARSGVAPSALRYYERRGPDPLHPHRRQPAPVRAGRAAPGRLHPDRPAGRRLAGGDPRRRWPRCRRTARRPRPTGPGCRARWRGRLDERIALLERLRDQLTGCIGCGCLSLTVVLASTTRTTRSPRTGRAAVRLLQPGPVRPPCRGARSTRPAGARRRPSAIGTVRDHHRHHRARLDQRPHLARVPRRRSRPSPRPGGPAASWPTTVARLAISAPRSSSRRAAALHADHDEPAVGGQRVDVARQVGRTHDVEDDVAPGRSVPRRSPRRCSRSSGRRRASAAASCLAARAVVDHAGAEGLAELDRERADAAAAAVHQQRLARPAAGRGRPRSTRPCRPPRAGPPPRPGEPRRAPAAAGPPVRRPAPRNRRRPAGRTPRRRAASLTPSATASTRRPEHSSPGYGGAPSAAGRSPARCSRSARLTALAATSTSTSPGAGCRVGHLGPVQHVGAAGLE